MAEKRRPIHLGIAVGVSASLYAVSLAAVTGLQSAQNAQISVVNGPLAHAADDIDSANDALEARLDSAQAAFDSSAATLSDVADKVPGFEDRLKTLAGTVTKIRGTSFSIPSRGTLPRVSSSRPAAVKPPVHTTTTASGH